MDGMTASSSSRSSTSYSLGRCCAFDVEDAVATNADVSGRKQVDSVE